MRLRDHLDEHFKTTSPQGDGNLLTIAACTFSQKISKPHPRKGTECTNPSLPCRSGGGGPCEAWWKGRLEQSTHLHREKVTSAASAPTGSHRSPPPPFRRGRRIAHIPARGRNARTPASPATAEATEKVFLFYISDKENTIYCAAAFAKQQHIDRKNFFHLKFCTFSVTSHSGGGGPCEAWWKGRLERSTHLHREKGTSAASAPTGSHRSPPPPFRRGRRIEHHPRKGTETR